MSAARQLHDMQPPARENFEHKQGIEMALEIKIRDKRIEVEKFEAKLAEASDNLQKRRNAHGFDTETSSR